MNTDNKDSKHDNMINKHKYPLGNKKSGWERITKSLNFFMFFF